MLSTFTPIVAQSWAASSLTTTGTLPYSMVEAVDAVELESLDPPQAASAAATAPQTANRSGLSCMILPSLNWADLLSNSLAVITVRCVPLP
jgi:hypothetical protein